MVTIKAKLSSNERVNSDSLSGLYSSFEAIEIIDDFDYKFEPFESDDEAWEYFLDLACYSYGCVQLVPETEGKGTRYLCCFVSFISFVSESCIRLKIVEDDEIIDDFDVKLIARAIPKNIYRNIKAIVPKIDPTYYALQIFGQTLHINQVLSIAASPDFNLIYLDSVEIPFTPLEVNVINVMPIGTQFT